MTDNEIFDSKKITKSEKTIDSAIDFLQKIKDEGEVVVKFRKKSGEYRLMRCTLDFKKIPKKDWPKDVNVGEIMATIKNKQIIHVFDLERMQWRSVPFEDTFWLQDKKNNVFKIKK